METKTIRFEKDGYYTIGYLMPLFTDKQIDNLFNKGIHMYSPIKSFTVQINIIEDVQEPQREHKCIPAEWATDGGGDYCKKCGYRI